MLTDDELAKLKERWKWLAGFPKTQPDVVREYAATDCLALLAEVERLKTEVERLTKENRTLEAIAHPRCTCDKCIEAYR